MYDSENDITFDVDSDSDLMFYMTFVDETSTENYTEYNKLLKSDDSILIKILTNTYTGCGDSKDINKPNNNKDVGENVSLFKVVNAIDTDTADTDAVDNNINTDKGLLGDNNSVNANTDVDVKAVSTLFKVVDINDTVNTVNIVNIVKDTNDQHKERLHGNNNCVYNDDVKVVNALFKVVTGNTHSDRLLGDENCAIDNTDALTKQSLLAIKSDTPLLFTDVYKSEFKDSFSGKGLTKDAVVMTDVMTDDVIDCNYIVDNFVNRSKINQNPECYKSIAIDGYYFCEKFVEKHSVEKISNMLTKVSSNKLDSIEPLELKQEIVRRYVINELTTCNGEVCDTNNESSFKYVSPIKELSNLDLSHVYLQLEKLYSEFKYLGFTLRNYVDNAESVKYSNLHNIYLYDQLMNPALLKELPYTKMCLVLNTGSWEDVGIHWQCMYIDKTDETIYIFDSMPYNTKIDYDISLVGTFANTLGYKIVDTNKFKQHGGYECGMFVIFYVICRLLGITHTAFTNIPNNDLGDEFCKKLRNAVYVNQTIINMAKDYVNKHPL